MPLKPENVKTKSHFIPSVLGAVLNSPLAWSGRVAEARNSRNNHSLQFSTSGHCLHVVRI